MHLDILQIVCNNCFVLPMDIQKLLKNNGYRVTTERQHVINVINEHPLTVQEIYNELKKGQFDIDLASVYRSLNLFVKLGIVRALELGEGKKRYVLVEEHNHHHHLVCNNCGSIENITMNENYLLKAIDKKSKFKIDHHHLEFFGRCANCQ